MKTSGDKIKVCWLYSHSMNLYGDRGNIIAINRRVKWRGKEMELVEYNIGQKCDFDDIDLFFFGGGQDKQQFEVADDLKEVGKKIKAQIKEKKAGLLAICGGMQLMARYYQTKEGERFEGVGLFDAYTEGGEERFIGNVVIETNLTGEAKQVVGFENHSGRTYLGDEVTPFGRVISGSGNNGNDQTEGVVFQTAVGSYLHGSLLPKNPFLTDWLIQRAFERRYGSYQLDPLANDVEDQAWAAARGIAMKTGRVNNITSGKGSK